MSFYQGSLLFTAVTSAALGAFVYLQSRRKAPNVTLALLSLSIGAWSFGQFMGEVVAGEGAVIFWTRTNIAAAILIPVFYFNFVAVFSKRQAENKIALRLAYAAAGFLFFFDLTPLFVAGVAPRLGYRFYPVAGPVYPIFTLYLATLFFSAFFKLIGFIRTSVNPTANQAKYVLAASIIGFAGGVTAFFPVYNLSWPVVSQFALPVYLSIIVFAIVRHKLLDINLVIRAGLIYSTLTLLFAGFYSFIIIGANELFQSYTGYNEYFVMSVVVFASVVVFQPLYNRVQALVDRLFFKGSYYYEKTISDLSAENVKLSALGTFAAGMAHEIKNPLASIKGLTQVLPENLEDPEFIRTYSEIVPRQLDRINRIVEDLLAFGRPAKMVMGKIDVINELDGVLRLVENQCREANIEVVREFQAAPPLIGNAEKLTQALMNIILNAIQSMPGGGVLKLRVTHYALRVTIEIFDTGPGIPAEALPNIFDPFYTTKETGTGMGLAVTYRIIKEHGGKIEVESEVGKGTKFKICLPIRRAPSV